MKGQLLWIAISAVSAGGCHRKESHIAQPADPNWTILKGTEAESLRKPCSRPFPPGLTGEWSPSVDDVARAEAKSFEATSDALDRLPPIARTTTPDLYRHQYAGFMRNGRRVLYLNAVVGGGHGWRLKAKDVCDGGLIAFGTVFDLDRDAFETVVFNGALGGPLVGGGWDAVQHRVAADGAAPRR
jgi:hypothetical protein